MGTRSSRTSGSRSPCSSRALAQGDSGAPEPVYTRRTAVQYARAFDKAGESDSATVWYERVVNDRDLASFKEAPLALPIAYRRLGELYEARGDAAKALERYPAFVKLWKDATRSCSLRWPRCARVLRDCWRPRRGSVERP